MSTQIAFLQFLKIFENYQITVFRSISSLSYKFIYKLKDIYIGKRLLVDIGKRLLVRKSEGLRNGDSTVVILKPRILYI